MAKDKENENEKLPDQNDQEVDNLSYEPEVDGLDIPEGETPEDAAPSKAKKKSDKPEQDISVDDADFSTELGELNEDLGDFDNNLETEDDPVDPVTVQPVEFMSFDNDKNPSGEENKNLEMLLDVKLELTVELGRCELPIKKILELTRDSIIELNKIAGEPVALFANGKHIANGEVVVIEDNFALRITSIIEPEKRLKSLG